MWDTYRSAESPRRVAAAWLALERGVNWQNLQLIIVLKNLTLLNIKHEQLVDDSGVSPRFDWQHISKAVTPENSFSLVPTYLVFFFSFLRISYKQTRDMLLSSSATTKRYNFISWISVRGTTDRPTLVSNTLKPFTILSFHSVFKWCRVIQTKAVD